MDFFSGTLAQHTSAALFLGRARAPPSRLTKATVVLFTQGICPLFVSRGGLITSSGVCLNQGRGPWERMVGLGPFPIGLQRNVC